MFAFDQRIYVFTNTRCFAICDTFYSEILIFLVRRRELFITERICYTLEQWRTQVSNGAWANSNTSFFLSLTEEDYDHGKLI